MAKLRVFELFAGIGACSKALERLGVDFEIVDAVEIDKYAIKSFNAVHGTNFEPQDICEWDKDIEVDLIMHGSPCQDFSVAGKQAGGDKDSGTRSSLMYETLRIVEKLKPRYVIWENVKNLLSKKHRHNFDAYLEAMEDMGYTNYYQVLNAKDYGVPQNRERVFTVSILGDQKFKFPARRPLPKRLKDVLEPKVDEKYYLSDEQVARFVRSGNCNPSGKGMNGNVCTKDISPTITTNKGEGLKIQLAGKLDIKGHDQIKRVYSDEGCSPALNTMQGGNRQPKIIEDFYKARPTRVYDKIAPTLRSERSRLKVQEPFVVASRGRGDNNEQHLAPRKDELTNTITSVQKDNYVATPYRIRKLTPKESWRLMSFTDDDFEKAEKVNSNTQLYKQAGNSIVVNVLEAILKELLYGQ